MEGRGEEGGWHAQEIAECLESETTRWQSPPGWLIETWLTGLTAEVEQSSGFRTKINRREKKNLIGSCINFLKRQVTAERQGDSVHIDRLLMERK